MLSIFPSGRTERVSFLRSHPDGSVLTDRDLVETPTLEYLELLRDPDPQAILDGFLKLADGEPGITVRDGRVPSDNLAFSELFITDNTLDEETESFLRWWLEEYRDTISGKIDSLTGLISRDHWDRSLRFEVQNSLENYTVVLLDIDHFKSVNDTYGHQAGDDVLEGIGRILRDVFGSEGHVVRYGGEEFLVLARCDREETLARSKQLRQSVAAEQFFDDQPDPITVSLGVSCPDNDGSPEDRIEEADLALYSSKSRGRDRTTVFAPYMKHRQRLSVWGFYRYLWGTDARFCLNPRDDRFCLYREDELISYSWSENSPRRVSLSEAFLHPARELVHGEQGVLLIDADGELWKARPSGVARRLSDDGCPVLVSLASNGSRVVGVGINNQLYEVRAGDIDRIGSLPKDWDDLFLGGSVYLLVDQKIVEWTEHQQSILTEVPEAARDCSADVDRLVISSMEGNLYQFNRELNHWKELNVPDLFNDPVRVRNISHHGENYLFKDGSGRLILARHRSKSVPQEMDLSSVE